MKIFSSDYLKHLSFQAKNNQRKRQHSNIHQTFEEPCQRLFNAIEPGSYIQPHRHISDRRDELLVALHGLMAVMIFDEQGNIIDVIQFGTEKFGSGVHLAVEIPPNVWHTVVALEQGSVLLEVKAGPFNPEKPKDLASWAPTEKSLEAEKYLQRILQHTNNRDLK
jgi:cupin fold WbuC family metalloprotein